MRIANLKTDKNDFSNVLFQTRVHWVNNLIPAIYIMVGIPALPFIMLDLYRGSIHGIFSIITFALGYVFLKGVGKLIENLYTKVELTADHLTITKGLLDRKKIDFPVRKLLGHELYISFLGRCLNYGQLYVTTGGLRHTVRVAKVRQLRRELLKQSNSYSLQGGFGEDSQRKYQ